MTDEYLQGINDRSQLADVHYVYSPHEQAQREELIRLIEAEKRAFHERIEPYLKKLAAIHGTPRMIIRTGLR